MQVPDGSMWMSEDPVFIASSRTESAISGADVPKTCSGPSELQELRFSVATDADTARLSDAGEPGKRPVINISSDVSCKMFRGTHAIAENPDLVVSQVMSSGAGGHRGLIIRDICEVWIVNNRKLRIVKCRFFFCVIRRIRLTRFNHGLFMRVLQRSGAFGRKTANEDLFPVLYPPGP